MPDGLSQHPEFLKRVSLRKSRLYHSMTTTNPNGNNTLAIAARTEPPPSA